MFDFIFIFIYIIGTIVIQDKLKTQFVKYIYGVLLTYYINSVNFEHKKVTAAFNFIARKLQNLTNQGFKLPCILKH